MTVRPRPPRVLALLVRLRSRGDEREAIEADLEELYAGRCETRGRVYAFARYVRDVLSLWRPLRPRLGALASDAGRAWDRGRARTPMHIDAVRDVLQDIRYAGRRLGRHPASTIAAMATLALAVGANVAIFNLIDRVVLHPLDVPNASELMTPQRTFQSRGVQYRRGALDWEQVDRVHELATLPDVAVSSTTLDPASRRMVLAMKGHSEPDIVDGRFVSENFFRVLGLRPVLGRDFDAADDAGEGASVVIVGETFWRTRLGAARDIVGQSIQVNGVPAVIVGVASSSFTGTELGAAPPALFLPLMSGARLATDIGAQTDGRGRHFTSRNGDYSNANLSPVSPLSAFSILARVKPRDRGRVQAEFTSVFGPEWSMVPLADTMLPFDARSELRRFLLLLAGAAALTFLIGCANLASLLLARTEERRGELAIRAALGAGRLRVVEELLVEAGLLAVAGTAAALIVSDGIERALSVFVLPGGILIGSLRHGTETSTILFASACAILAALVTGFAPALRAAGKHLALDVRREAAAPRLGGARLLAGVQAAICVVLVFAGLLFVRTLSHALATDVGFDAHGLASATISVPRSFRGYMATNEFVARARRIHGIVAVTTGPLPLIPSAGDMNAAAVVLDGVPAALATPVTIVYAAADYFTTLGQSLVTGRDFDERDHEGTEQVAILNTAAARALWSTTNPLGHHIGFPEGNGGAVPRTDRAVVGVVRDVKLKSLGDAGVPIIYLARQQNESYLAGYTVGSGNLYVILREANDVAGVAAALASAAADVGLSLQAVTPFDQRLGELLMPQRLGRALLLLLGVMALALTIVGVYGLTACVVARNTKEIGVRIALGAGAPAIVRAVVGRTYVPVLAGSAVGCVVAWTSGRLADRFMYGMRGSDVLTIVGAAVVVIASAGVATWLPARRALRIDPIETLRD